jgi:hypothetical protein
MSQVFATPPIPRPGTESIALRSGMQRISTGEIALLLAFGALAALAMGLVHLGLRLPGHAVLKPILPIAIAAAFVPRRASGCVVGLAAGAMAAVMLAGQWGQYQPAALASLVLLGPALDLAARGAHGRSVLLARFAAAGCAANMAAMGVKLLASVVGFESGGGGFAASWPLPIFSFALCGAFAGLVGAAIALAVRGKNQPTDSP